MTEASLWRWFSTEVRRAGGEAVRVENRLQVGTSDLVWTLDGKAGWLELKETTWPKDGPLMIDNLTLDQVVFLEAWGNGSGRAHLLVRVPNWRNVLVRHDLVRYVYERKFTKRTLSRETSSSWSFDVVHFAGLRRVLTDG